MNSLKVVVFGIGSTLRKISELLSSFNIVAYCDNDKNKQGMIYQGNVISNPREILSVQYDYVIICSVYIQSVRKQLLEMNVHRNKIIPYYLVRKLLGLNYMPIITAHYNFKCHEKKNVAIFFNELIQSGAPMSLMPMISMLQEKGCNIVVYADNDGILREVLCKKKIEVIIVKSLKFLYLTDLLNDRHYDMVILNTVGFYNLLRNNKSKIPVLWWLHESKMYYSSIPEESFCDLNFHHIYTYAAGQQASENFLSRCDYGLTTLKGELYYGRLDYFRKRVRKYDKGVITFAVIGNTGYVKGQDIYLDAIRKLVPSISRRGRFMLVGRGSKDYLASEKNNDNKLSNVYALGEITQREIQSLYYSLDVVICPSRCDTMPIVVTEAMMCHVPCIVSDCVGQSKFIIHEKNGWIFQSGNCIELASLVAKIIEDKYNLIKIGDEARKIYDKYFSIAVFENNFQKILNDITAIR